jgi:uncharacterized protein (UPF0332 family)
LKKKAIKHIEAPELFLELVKQHKIPPSFADLRKNVLVPAINLKSKADYKGLFASKLDAERWIKLAEKFLNSAEECLKE